MMLEGGDEGEFSILYNQLNLLEIRLIENMEKLKKEKRIFKKYCLRYLSSAKNTIIIYNHVK